MCQQNKLISFVFGMTLKKFRILEIVAVKQTDLVATVYGFTVVDLKVLIHREKSM